MAPARDPAVTWTIGEVSRLVGVPAHTLRYWERMFPDDLRPIRTAGAQRRYDVSTVAAIQDIRRLLREELYSIRGAQQVLRGRQRAPGG